MVTPSKRKWWCCCVCWPKHVEGYADYNTIFSLVGRISHNESSAHVHELLKMRALDFSQMPRTDYPVWPNRTLEERSP
jgi:hypothetical protein